MSAQPTEQWIKNTAARIGFMGCGIAASQLLEVEAKRLEVWLRNGYHGKMSYLENHFDKRVDPGKLVDNAASVISLAYNYAPNNYPMEDHDYKLPRYALGEDYHFVVKEKLRLLVDEMQSQLGQFAYRIFVDSGPVMERVWAQKAGLGWIGKHGLLIHKSKGSYFFLAEIICDIALQPDPPFSQDHCGTCNKCVEACPTDAILPNKTLNANQCISYLTIELKDAIPESFHGKMNHWIFGCDICQEVCPWNKFSTPHQEPRFEPHPDLKEMTSADWNELTRDTFNNLFKKSAIKRAGYHKLKQTISIQTHDPDHSGSGKH
jgi:epoxyqueuosine reductase